MVVSEKQVIRQRLLLIYLLHLLKVRFQKIKDVDLDFNFGQAIEVDHIFQHRDVSPSSLDVSLENGSIVFEPWDESDVRVECQAKVYRVKDSDEARRFFLTESVFRVNEHKLLFHTKSKAMKVQTKIFVPRVLFQHIKLYAFNGQISGGNITADTFDVNAMNGALTFDHVQAKKALVETINGAISTKNVTIDMLDAKTLNGGITISGQVQDLDAETVNGSVTYELDRLTESGYVDVKAMTGSITLFIPKDLRIEGKLKTNVGNFHIAMADYEELEEKKEFAQKALSFIGNQQSSPRVKVSALTNTGTIQINDR